LYNAQQTDLITARKVTKVDRKLNIIQFLVVNSSHWGASTAASNHHGYNLS